MRLVHDWRQCWRWYSTHGTVGAIGCLIYAWNAMPERMKDQFPAHWVVALAVVMLAGGFIGRLIDQTPQEKPPCGP